MKQIYLKCPICDHTNSNEDFKVYEADCIFIEIDDINQHLIRHQCSNCGVIFGTQQMLNLSKEKLKMAYEKIYLTGHQEGDSSQYQFDTFFMFNPTKNGIYINWGSGASKSSDMIRSSGYNIIEYDPFVENINSRTYASTEQIMSMKFDGIMSHNVMEHFQDPIKELKLMKPLLKQDAYMIHSSDCYKYKFEFTKYHLFFFTEKSVEILSNKADLKHEFIDTVRVKFLQK